MDTEAIEYFLPSDTIRDQPEFILPSSSFKGTTPEACCNKAVEVQPVDEALLFACT